MLKDFSKEQLIKYAKSLERENKPLKEKRDKQVKGTGFFNRIRPYQEYADSPPGTVSISYRMIEHLVREGRMLPGAAADLMGRRSMDTPLNMAQNSSRNDYIFETPFGKVEITRMLFDDDISTLDKIFSMIMKRSSDIQRLRRVRDISQHVSPFTEMLRREIPETFFTIDDPLEQDDSNNNNENDEENNE